MVAKKHRMNIFPEGMPQTLLELKKRGYKIAIVSGVRTDIISAMLGISGLTDIDYIYGQRPILDTDHANDIKELQEKGTIEFVIGNKLDDITMGPKEAKKVFITWVHSKGGEEAADYTINKPEELLKLIV